MVRQHIQSLYVVKGTDKTSKPVQKILLVGEAGNHHMADPDGDIVFIKIMGKGKDGGEVLPGQCDMSLWINVLDIEHD